MLVRFIVAFLIIWFVIKVLKFTVKGILITLGVIAALLLFSMLICL